MTCLTNLPPEILLRILEHLSLVGPLTFLTSQATCRVFRLLAQDLLFRSPTPPPGTCTLSACGEDQRLLPRAGTGGGAPNALLARRFSPLFLSANCFTAEERRAVRWFLTLNGDVARPFRRLPWASDARERDVYLRPGASWQALGVTFGAGPPITNIEIVKSYASEEFNEDGRDHVQHLRAASLIPGPPPRTAAAAGGDDDVNLLPTTPGFLTMGHLYNLLLRGGVVGDSSAVTFGDETGGWELFLGRKLRSYELLTEYECFIPDDEDLVDMGPGAAQSAILYVRGGTVEGVDQDRRFIEPEDDEVDWIPQPLDNVPSIQLMCS